MTAGYNQAEDRHCDESTLWETETQNQEGVPIKENKTPERSQ